VITGVGAVTCLGRDAASLWDGLAAGRSGFGPVTRFPTAGLSCTLGGLLPEELDLGDRLARGPEPLARLVDRVALHAVDEALEQAGLKPLPAALARRMGVFLVCGSGDLLEYEDWLAAGGDPVAAAALRPFDCAADRVAGWWGLRGPRSGFVTACSSGLVALVRAVEALRRGDADAMLAGGADLVSRLCFHGFQALRAMDPEPCKPFDRRRRGMTLGDGGAALVLETLEHARGRGARPLAEVLGYGLTQDAYHIATPDASGASWARTLAAALQDSGLPPEEVGYINAHATATKVGGVIEAQAIANVYGDKPYVSGLKSYLGHTMGTCGVIELILATYMMEQGFLAPTLNLDNIDERCRMLRHTPELLDHHTKIAAIQNFAFGGVNTCLLVKSGTCL